MEQTYVILRLIACKNTINRFADHQRILLLRASLYILIYAGRKRLVRMCPKHRQIRDILDIKKIYLTRNVN